MAGFLLPITRHKTMTIRFVEDIYADFLFDCYTANQHLTDEDWHYYGREEHHIELPERDGGVLTPLNSQPLTTYQHWIAGILQSEVLGKCCFACVPKGALPLMFETLRVKWAKHHGTQTSTNREISDETKGKIRNALLNHTVNEETRAKIGNALRGKELPSETRRKMSESRTGKPNANRGRKWYTNPVTQDNKLFTPGQQPNGWVEGMSEVSKMNVREGIKKVRTVNRHGKDGLPSFACGENDL